MNEEDKLSRQVTKVLNSKSVHITLTGHVHKRLRAMLFLQELSMQKFFRLMSEKVVDGDEYITKLIEEKVIELKEQSFFNLSEVSEKDLYNVIEENSPFKKDK